MTKVLLVEDNETLSTHYSDVLSRSGLEVITAANAAEGLEVFTEQKPCVIALDLVLPDRDGLDMMRDCLTQAPNCKVVVITAHGTIPTAVESMRQGAFEFLPKPFSDDQLLSVIGQAASAEQAAWRAKVPDTGPARPSDPTGIPPLPGMIGTSPAMQELSRQIRSVADSPAPVFLFGESGTGKMTCARAVHTLSARKTGTFEVLRPVGVPVKEQAELVRTTYAAAFGGTLVISDPFHLTTEAQDILSNRIASNKDKPNAPRLVTIASRTPLSHSTTDVLSNSLTHQLFVVPIKVPALRDRGEDVVTLANAALREFDTRTENRITGLSPDVAAVFRSYDWPGNVLQLINTLHAVVMVQTGPLVTLDMIPADVKAAPGATSKANPDALLGLPLAEAERIIIERTIDDQGGSIPKAAKILGLSPSTIYRKRESWDALGVD